MNKKKIKNFIFIPGRIKQWRKFEYDSFSVWLAGLNKKKKFEQIKNYLNSNFKNIKKKKIYEILGNQFGIIISNNSWIFAATDPTRSYPIFWKIDKNIIFLSSKANLLKTRHSIINLEQLKAYRMSGYTTNDQTLWKNIYNLKSGSFLFFTERNELQIKQYFLYQPWKIKNKNFSQYKIILKKEINNLFINLIKEANGRRIIVPLSAGLDSRLILSGLKKHNYKNVKCFSYGLKNNFESIIAKRVAKKIGYEWKFVEIKHKKAREFYTSNKFNSFFNLASDGINVPVTHSLYAINELLKIKYIGKNDIIVNGNSGDFISGGHIPTNRRYFTKPSHNLNALFNKVFHVHFTKHYSLWETLINKENKEIIKNILYIQLKQSIKENEKITEYGILELLEYENRQVKHVVNGQRIYDYYKLDWLLPLWNKSFIMFWQTVPLKYKLSQKLYKRVLFDLNFGEVWREGFEAKYYITPSWMRVISFFIKVLFVFSGKSKWHKFERRYIDYWTDIVCAPTINSYFKTIKNKNGFRNVLSWLALKAEKLNLGKSWQ